MIEIKKILKSRSKTISILEGDKPLLSKIDLFSNKIFNSLKNGKKIIFCGNGGSFAQASHMSGELSGRFLKDRISQGSIVLGANFSSLTAIGNDYSFDKVFSRELEGIGDHGDLLIAYSTSGNSQNIINALKTAKNKKIESILFSGNDGGSCKEFCDYDFIISSKNTPIIQEMHLIVGHIILEIVDQKL